MKGQRITAAIMASAVILAVFPRTPGGNLNSVAFFNPAREIRVEFFQHYAKLMYTLGFYQGQQVSAPNLLPIPAARPRTPDSSS